MEQKGYLVKKTSEELDILIKSGELQDNYKTMSYKGKDQLIIGLSRILELTKAGSNIYHFGNIEKVFELLGTSVSQKWIDQRVSKKIFTHDILHYNYTSEYLNKNNELELRKIKFLPNDKDVKSSYQF